MKKHVDYQEYLLGSLEDPEEAAGYLNAALEGGDIHVFLLALQNVIKSQGGMKKIADKAHKSRTSLYKTLSKNGNPYLQNTNKILLAMGLHFAIVPIVKKKTGFVRREA
jgi:probable addiction module antidote protein